jgi:SAM-dependent methyltransferase
MYDPPAQPTSQRDSGKGGRLNRQLLKLLCDPVSRDPLELHDELFDERGQIVAGYLKSPTGAQYPIRNGIPRFVQGGALRESVRSFGDEWNFFNFTHFKNNWLFHSVKNTFGSPAAFAGKTILDAGGGSGAQTLWMLEAGAAHVILLELSDSVDDVVKQNLGLSGYRNYDVLQCSLDAPPLLSRSIDGIVYCHNVIQHTPSVEETARALFNLVAPGGEFVFNCYQLNDTSPARWVRFHLVYRPLRRVLSSLPFWGILSYARLMGLLREVPVLGMVLEKASFCVQGEVPREAGEAFLPHLRRRFRATVLNTFDGFGSHAFQHHRSDSEIRTLLAELQPDATRILNADKYFLRPPPVGCALRVFR